MKLISWNVNGLRAVWKTGVLQSLLRDESPDVISIQEIKAQVDDLAHLTEELEHYNLYSSPSQKKGYSGVACLVHKKYPFNDKKIKHALGFPEFEKEGRFLVLYFPTVTLYNIYFPSGTMGEERQNFKYAFLEAMYSFFKSLPDEEFNRSIICGDFNICHQEIDIHHPKEATQRKLSGFLPKERCWLDDFLELGFIDTFRYCNPSIKDQYTWWTFRAGARKRNLGWRIDYFFVAKKLASKIEGAPILSNIVGSDHCPISLMIGV